MQITTKKPIEMKTAINHELDYLLRSAREYKVESLMNTMSNIHSLMLYRKHIANNFDVIDDQENIKLLLDKSKTEICMLLGIVV